MVTKKEIIKTKEQLDSLEYALEHKDTELMKEIRGKYKVEELKKEAEEAEKKAWNEYNERRKTLDNIAREVEKIKMHLMEQVNKYNKETFQKFMDKIRKLLNEGWQIYNVYVNKRYQTIERTVGDDLSTNFRPEYRVISEILPAKTQFKYKVKYFDSDKTLWGSIPTKNADDIEVALLRKMPEEHGQKDEKMTIVWRRAFWTDIDKEEFKAIEKTYIS